MRSTVNPLLIVFLFLILTFSVSGQAIRICDRSYICKSAIDTDSGLLYFITNDSLKIVDLAAFKLLKESRLLIPEGILSVDLIPVCLDKILYLVNNLGGQVFKYEQGALVRLDHSFTHKMQLSSVVFTNHGSIYRYGGYGFWSFRNIFTYFDPLTREWELVQPAGSKVFPPGSAYGNTVKVINDDWYVFGGSMLDESQPILEVLNNQCWVFHSGVKKWEFLGLVKEDLVKPNLISKVDYGINVALVINAKTYVLDLQHNRMKEYNNSVAANSIRSQPKDYITSYFYKGNFLILGASSSDPDVKLQQISEADFLSDYIGERQIYATNSLFIIVCLLFSFLSIALVAYFWYRKKSQLVEKISIAEGKLTYKLRDYQPDIEHLSLLNLFLRADELSTNDLCDFLHKEHLHYSQNTRIINNMIDELNFNIGMLMQKEVKVILKHKSDVDKRIKVYSIQKKYFTTIN